jgi:hypothetical protein
MLVLFDKPEAVPKFFDSSKEESKIMKISIAK